MNYYIHNNTNGYENPNFNLRAVVLETLKGYGIFGHLRDTYLHQLDYNNVEDWLWDSKGIEKEIKDLKQKIKDAKKQVHAISEEELQVAYQKEVDRLNWYNDPKSNYYAAQVVKMENCINSYKKGLSSFLNLCDIQFVNDALTDIIMTTEKDLEKARNSAIRDADRIESHPYPIPTYENFVVNYIKEKKDWVKRFQDDLKSKQESLKRIEENNRIIKCIFEYIEKAEKGDK